MADDTNVQLITYLVVCAPAAIASWIIEPKRRKKAPTTRPYTWGIYISLVQVLLGGLLAIAALLNGTPSLLFLFGFAAAALVASGVGGYNRRKWGFVACAVLSLNPIGWIANYIYGKNRWSEFEAEELARSAAAGVALPELSEESR